jgi:hypothetical protein
MPDAWDDVNLKANLQVLASLREGDNLRLDTATGRYARQAGANAVQRFFTQSLPRTITPGLSITNDALYATPLTQIFERAKACAGGGQGGVNQQDIAAALEGLRNLQRFYQRKYGATKKDDEKSNTIDAIVAKVEEVVRGKTGFQVFREHYRNRLVFGFCQNDLIPKGNPGVCRALCLDWLRRKVKSGKDSFAVSKASGKGPLANNARMRRKADRRLIGMQGILDELDFENKLNEQAKLDRLKAEYDVITGMRGTEVKMGPDFHIFAVDGVVQPEDAGDRLFRGVLEAAQYHRARDDEPSGCYMLHLYTGLQPSGDAHAVAFHLSDSRLHFMDPNIGEFQFHMPFETKEVVTLGGHLWEVYEKSDVIFTGWRLLNYWYYAGARP